MPAPFVAVAISLVASIAADSNNCNCYTICNVQKITLVQSLGLQAEESSVPGAPQVPVQCHVQEQCCHRAEQNFIGRNTTPNRRDPHLGRPKRQLGF